MSSKTAIVLAIVSALFLLTANFALWLNNSIFDRQAFARTTVDVVKTQDVRNAIGAETVNQVFKDNPVVKRVLGDTIQSAISGLLASQAAQPVLQEVAQEANILITAPEPQEVKFDISGVKAFIKPIASALNKETGRTIASTKIPNSIVLIKKGEVPSIYSWGVVLLWLGPILGLIGLGIIVGLIWRAGFDRRPSVLRVTGLTLAIGSLIFIILIRTLKAPMLASIVSANVRVIADSIFDAFAGQLTGQTWWLVIAGVAIAAIGYLLPRARETEPARKMRDLKIAS